uniref:TOD1/MUCI70 glycosyltransferase-like domain-containing protein n=1 Tax=Ananas comosus var. bracteatus TaxID=296719 RepID=A0A6V7NUD3_ANACO|nr:unnamed protein product [Ananas comosus var. bracteatus]
MVAEEAASKSSLSSSSSPAKKTIVDLRIKVLYGDDHGGERGCSWWWWSWWMRRARLRRRLRSVIVILLVVFSLFSFYLGHNVINMIHTPPSANIFMVQTWMNTTPTTKEYMAKNGTGIHVPASVKIIADQYCKDFVPSAPPVDKKRTGPRACDVCYLPFESALASMPTSPSESPVLKNLNYVVEDGGPVKYESNGGSPFGGYPSLQQRSENFNIKESMTVHCGFVKGETPGLNTGFDIDEVDRHEMSKCDGIVVVSTIFGDYDTIKQPEHVNEYSKIGVCFIMFVDEKTEAHIRKTNTLDSTRKLGLWKVVVARNLPYDDDRRNGKIPKMLPHRLFPNARWSLWIDGKLRLTKDPILILERYLWRHKYSQAISKHYRRFDVFEEGLANMVAGNTTTLPLFANSKSDVPEGCVIIREHTPLTNLFSCLWFNEVDRFTSRDQLSFAIVRNKINASVGWLPYMFPDCERRNFVIQSYHKDVMKQKSSPTPPVLTIELPRNHSPPPPVPIKDLLIKSPRKRDHVRRHRRDRKSR